MTVILSVLLLILSFNSYAEISSKLNLYNKLKGPGLGLLIIKNGEVIKKEGYGFADRENKVKITATTNFNIASNSKQFTAFSIFLLERAGKIQGDDEISKYIPEIPEYAKNIKIKHLLYHTSGLPDYMEICTEINQVTNKNVIDLLQKKKALTFFPGTKHEYSNTGYVILSEIVERVSKIPFYDFIQNEIFNKLNMKNSFVLRNDGKDLVKNRAVSYSEWPFFEKKGKDACDSVYGDGGVLTNLDDYEKWLKILSGDTPFLSETELEKLFTAGILNDGSSTNYAYGWMWDEYKGNKFIVHTGAWQNFRSFVLYIPQKRMWIAILANYKSIPAWDLIKELAFN